MKKTPIKVIISTFGPLHLIKAAESLSPFVNLKIIQGWIPIWWDYFLFKIAKYITRRDLSRSMKNRVPICLKNKIFSCRFAEIYFVIGRILKLKSFDYISSKALELYGSSSLKYIKEANVFHVRSGSGRGGAIERARSEGMIIIVDHSSPHPAFAECQLSEEYKKNKTNLNIGKHMNFWQYVLSDCEKADCLLVNSNFVKDTFVNMGYSADKIRVVTQGVRNDFIGIKSNYFLSSPIKILFSGYFSFRKGAEYMLKALNVISTMGIDFNFIVVGECENSERLTELYKNMSIFFHGRIAQDELKYFLKTSDIYLFPSLLDGCASSGLEAMGAGLPVIATKESGLPIINKVDGLIVESKNVQEIVDALVSLISDKDLREYISRNASNKIYNEYTWENYAINVKSIYEDLVH